MAQERSEESKVHDPTPRRLEDLRRKGEIPRSADLAAAIGYSGILLALVGAGSGISDRLGSLGTALVARPDRIAPLLFDGHGAALPGGLLGAAGAALAPLWLVPAALVVLALMAQRALVFTPAKLAPKLSRISPVQNAQNKFGLSGLVEFLKSFAKLVVYSAALGLYIAGALDRLVVSATFEPRQVAILVGRITVEFLAIVVVIALGIGAIDLIWQHVEHRRKNRMSHKELRDETKEAEGDPFLKERRRQKGQALARNGSLADVPDASVVVVNPTHVAVALKWSRSAAGAPVCVAKGVDEVALRVRRLAEEAGVPLRHDPATARALHATVEVGEEIGPELYGPVAAAIRFSEDVRARARRSFL
jgi:flagellar biosynthetic protein FlhB